MLDGLKSSLGDAIKKIVKSSGIDEELIKDLCKDVQRALLTSDVNVRLVLEICLLYTSPSPRDRQKSRMPSSA